MLSRQRLERAKGPTQQVQRTLGWLPRPTRRAQRPPRQLRLALPLLPRAQASGLGLREEVLHHLLAPALLRCLSIFPCNLVYDLPGSIILELSLVRTGLRAGLSAQCFMPEAVETGGCTISAGVQLQ